MVKPLPATRETWVRSLGWEDPLEKEMATQPSTLAWKIPWMDEPGRLQSMGSQRVGHDWVTSLGSRNYSKYLKHFNSFYSSHESCEVFKKMYIIWILQMSLLKHRKVNSLCRAAKWQRQARQSALRSLLLARTICWIQIAVFSSRFVLESPIEVSKNTTAQTQPKYGEL